MLHLSPLVRIIDDFAILHHTTLAALVGPSRARPLTRMRQEAYYLCRVDPSQPTLKMIAKRFGGRDHSTIIHGIEKHCLRSGLPKPPSKYPGRPRPQPVPKLQQKTQSGDAPVSLASVD